jgi:hypothetical protein
MCRNESVTSALSDEQNKVLITAGALLFALQTTEKMIALCAEHILQLDGSLTIALLHRQEKRKRTLGAVLTAMRNRVEIHELFDAALTEFLEKRNVFIHRISDAPGWSLDDETGRAAANRFLARLWQLNEIVLDVFCGLARASAEQDPDSPQFPDVVHFGKSYRPVIDRIFSAKDEIDQT